LHRSSFLLQCKEKRKEDESYKTFSLKNKRIITIMNTNNFKQMFSRFPLENKNILASWTSFVGRTNWQPTATSRICSLHFNNDDYYQASNRLILKPGVLPKKYIVRNDNKENNDPFKILNDKLCE